MLLAPGPAIEQSGRRAEVTSAGDEAWSTGNNSDPPHPPRYDRSRRLAGRASPAGRPVPRSRDRAQLELIAGDGAAAVHSANGRVRRLDRRHVALGSCSVAIDTHNSCQRAIVVRNHGLASLFVCPYHTVTYDSTAGSPGPAWPPRRNGRAGLAPEGCEHGPGILVGVADLPAWLRDAAGWSGRRGGVAALGAIVETGCWSAGNWSSRGSVLLHPTDSTLANAVPQPGFQRRGRVGPHVRPDRRRRSD